MPDYNISHWEILLFNIKLFSYYMIEYILYCILQNKKILYIYKIIALIMHQIDIFKYIQKLNIIY